MKVLKRKVKGFTLTFEVLFSILLLVSFMYATAYLISCMNIDRYVSTVATSALIQESKMGGRSNTLTKINIGTNDIINSTNINLKKSLKNTNVGDKIELDGGPDCIDSSNTKVWVSVEWEYPPFLSLFGETHEGIHKTQKIEMESLVEPGSLLTN